MNSRKFIAVFLLTFGLSCSLQAQVLKLRKGQPFPFEEGAAMDLATYRAGRAKILAGEQLITHRQKIIDSLQALRVTYARMHAKDSTQIAEQKQILIRKEEVTRDLSGQVLSWQQVADDNKPNWFQRNGWWLVALPASAGGLYAGIQIMR